MWLKSSSLSARLTTRRRALPPCLNPLRIDRRPHVRTMTRWAAATGNTSVIHASLRSRKLFSGKHFNERHASHGTPPSQGSPDLIFTTGCAPRFTYTSAGLDLSRSAATESVSYTHLTLPTSDLV